MNQYAARIAKELSLSPSHTAAALDLIDQGNTIPFIARYRKEATGSMDDGVLRTLDERYAYLKKLDEQKETVKKAITEQGKWTQELEQALAQAETLAQVEDLYRPYRPKRKTKASVARERGLGAAG